MRISFTKRQYIGLASVVFMLVLWKLFSLYFNSDFILPAPEKTLLTTAKLFTDTDFLTVVGVTIIRGVVGFAISLILGLLVGIVAGISPNFNAFLNPILVVIRSTPVVAVILLALIWFSTGSVPIFIAFLTMFPFICTNVVDGIRSIDTNLTQMASFYKIERVKMVREVYIPAIMPFIISGSSSAMGIGWRAIIIGEVLSQPKFGIGTSMQAAQTFLKVDSVIAWTIVAVLISFIFERMIRWSEKKIVVWKA